MRYFYKVAWILLPVLMLALTGCGSNSSGSADPFNPGGTVGGTTPGTPPYSLTITPAKSAAFANEQLIATAVLKDASNTPIANQTVNFSITAGPATAVTTSARTDSNGIALAFVRTGATAVTTNVIVQGASTVNSKNVVGYGNFQVSPADGNLNSTRLSLSMTTLAVSPNQEQVIVATAKDASNNPIANLPVAFRVAAGPASMVIANSVTDSNGQATTIVKAGNPAAVSNVIVEATATVSGSAVVANIPFQVVPTTISTVNYTMTMAASKQVVDNNEEFFVQVLLKDSGANPVVGQTVAFSVASGEAAVITATAVTDSLGKGLARIRALNPASTSAVILQASATIDGTVVTAIAPVQITTQPFSASIIRLTLASDKQSVGINSDVILTATVTDMQSPPKPVQNNEVTFEILGTQGSIVDFSGNAVVTPYSVLTDSLGNAVCRVKSGNTTSSSVIIVKSTTTVNNTVVIAYHTVEVVRQNSYVINFLTSKSATDPDGTLNTLSADLPATAAGPYTFKQLVPLQVLDNNGIPRPNVAVSIKISNTGRNADTVIELVPPLPGTKVVFPGIDPLQIQVTTDDHGMAIFTCNVSLAAPGPGGYNAESVIYEASATVDGISMLSYGGFIASLSQASP
ncbi:Ig-like domain-containing protein [Geomonas nitrogeniifigens]|uniref:Ig-like domain-containing protein n=1 Tax=Geomonas diazotrophica TaxID=2843197 RepID=A0ABX8JR29_9BACT|nr:Ig-like domain-containing protein [Geomonas nitrogeniifigens]QWV99084.1 Ig-like domain-containing protein [Geomonas nitrogeniifigens]QXE88252.1 Ig-like domain-containing protein [Geomonas nitrogeniifigens]